MKKSIVLTLSIFSLLFSQFTVEQFAFGSAYPQAATDIFVPFSGSYLSEISSVDSKPVLRRRFSTSEYRLYAGKFAETVDLVSSNVHRFLRPKHLTEDQFYRMKFFDSKRINSVGDIQDSYFHDDTLFVYGVIRLFYYQSGKWETMDAVDIRHKKITGDLAIRSNPTGALIILNGETTGVTTPNYITDFPAGECRIRVVHSDCVPRETTITVISSNIHSISLDLNTRYGAVAFTGSPHGASVKYNGRLLGKIPCTIENLVPGEYNFSIEDPFYQRKTESVVVSSGGVSHISVQLAKSFGVIMLPEMPANRWWSINGEHVASGALRFNKGTHRIFWDGGEVYRSIDTIISLGLGDTVKVHAQMANRTGGVKVLPLPMACSLFVDGVYRGEAPIVIDGLKVGAHQIELARSGYARISQVVDVKGESVEEVRCQLLKLGTAIGSATNRIRELPAELSFISIEGPARIYQGDSLVAITGKGSVTIPAGRYEFRFESKDSSRLKTVTVANGERKSVLVSFVD